MPNARGLKERQLNARGSDPTRQHRHTPGTSDQGSHRPSHRPRTQTATNQSPSERRTRRSHTTRRSRADARRDSQHKPREERTQTGEADRSHHGRSRRKQGSTHGTKPKNTTKLRKKRTQNPTPNPEKSRPNPEKSRPNRKKEASATRRKPARKPTTNDKRSHPPAHPLCLKIRDRHDKNRPRRCHPRSGGRWQAAVGRGAVLRKRIGRSDTTYAAATRPCGLPPTDKARPEGLSGGLCDGARYEGRTTCAPGWFNYFFDNSRMPKSGLLVSRHSHATKER